MMDKPWSGAKGGRCGLLDNQECELYLSTGRIMNYLLCPGEAAGLGQRVCGAHGLGQNQANGT